MRLAEVGRELMTEDAIRMMLPHTQAIAVSGSAPPIRFMFPPNQKEVDPRKDEPKVHKLSAPPTLDLLRLRAGAGVGTAEVKKEKTKAPSRPRRKKTTDLALVTPE